MSVATQGFNRQCRLDFGLGKRSGKPKRRYDSYAEAVAAINGQSGMGPYRCDLCFSWHIGHPKTPITDKNTSRALRAATRGVNHRRRRA